MFGLSPSARRALPLALKSFLANLRNQTLVDVHLLEPPVHILKFPETNHRGRHAAVLGPPFVERGTTHAVLATVQGPPMTRPGKGPATPRASGVDAPHTIDMTGIDRHVTPDAALLNRIVEWRFDA